MMKVDKNEIEVVSGRDMPWEILMVAADQVSEWLQAGAPYTRPRSPEDLVEKVGTSIYAVYKGTSVGHVSLTEQPERVVLGNGAIHCPDVGGDTASYNIASLVVDPKVRGGSIGSFLIHEACEKVARDISGGHLGANESSASAIVSAIASRPSFLSFDRNGFSPDSVMEGSPPYSGVIFDRYLGKRVVSKIVGGMTS